MEAFVLDLANPEECLIACKDLFSKNEVDTVINCGGCSQRDTFDMLDFSVCSQLMDTNCMSHIAVCKAVLPGMMERKRGQIVNILSVFGYVGAPTRTMYSASKFALSGFGRALRSEAREHGIEVT